MDPKKIRNLADDPGLISGIYNYCDRWCERCPFTDKCLNYRMEQESRREAAFRKKEKEDRLPSAMWDDLKDTLEETIELLKELMQERGLDPDKIETDETYLNVKKEIREETKEHPLARMSLSYIALAEEWFNSHARVLEEMGMFDDKSEKNADEKTLQLQDAGEVIRWYLYQVNVKIQRALRGKKESLAYGKEEMPDDVNGSAKVALIGMDRSLAAWHRLMELMPAEETPIADIMILLGTLREKTEKEFPQARAFRRPGFDDPRYAGLLRKKR